MLKTSSTLPTKKKVGANKFVIGLAALVATAVVSVGGVAAAQTPGDGYGGTIISIGDIILDGSNNVINIILQIF